MNFFMFNYGKYLNNYYFILDYQDDLPSVILYKLFKNLQSVKNFKFSIFGKTKNTKKYLVKKEKKITKRLIKKTDEKIVLITTDNPLYDVLNINRISNKIKIEDGDEMIKPLYRMIPEEIRKTQEFYNIGYIKNDKFCNTSFKLFTQDDLLHSLSLSNKYNEKFYCIYLTEDNNKNAELLKQIEDKKEIILYFYEDNRPDILNSQFTRYLKYKSNLPYEHYHNINNYELYKELYKNGNESIMLGFSEDKLKEMKSLF